MPKPGKESSSSSAPKDKGAAFAERMSFVRTKKADKKKGKENAEAYIKKLEDDIAELGGDLEDPLKKKQHDDYKNMLEKERSELKELQSDLQNLEQEEKDIEMPDAADLKQEDSSAPPQLDVPGQNDGTDSSNPIVLEAELDLIKIGEKQPTAGLKDTDKYRKLEVTKNGQGGQKIGIFRYGPANASVFRREEVTKEVPEGVTDLADNNTRLGEASTFINGKRVWTLTRHNLVSVQGVAFPEEFDVKDLDPDRQTRRIFIPTDIYIKWSYKGEIRKSWETRTVFRRVWGKHGDGPDEAIFEAAMYAEKRFKEWRKGMRRSLSRSPTPNPDAEDIALPKANFKTSKYKNKKRDKKSKRKSRKSRDESDDSSDDSDDNDTSDDSDDEDSDKGGKKKKKGKKNKRKSRKSRYDSDESDSSESDSSDDADTTDDEIDPKKFKIYWCKTRGKKLQKLSGKDKDKMKKALKKAQNY
jgi:hypothetical protein